MKYESNLDGVLNDITKREELAAEAIGVLVRDDAKAKSPVAEVNGGNLRASNAYRRSGTEVTIGNTAEYAGYVEKGTRKMAAQPYLLPAVNENRNNIKLLVEQYLRG